MQISTDETGKKWISYTNYKHGSYENRWLMSYNRFNKYASKIITLDIIAVAIVYFPQFLNTSYSNQLKTLSKYHVFIFLFLILLCNTGFKKISHLQIVSIEKNCFLFLLHQVLLFALLLFAFIKPYLN